MRSVQESIALLLNPVSLTDAERRYRARTFSVLLYSDGAILVLVTLAFRREWLIIFAAWFFVTMALLSLFVKRVQKVARENGVVPSPEKQVIARREMSSHLKRPVILMAMSGTFLLFTGIYNIVGYLFGGIVLLSSLVLFLLARRWR